MLSHELLTVWRNNVSDTEEPYLWSDAEAYFFMNEAYFMFARQTGGIGDFESPEMEVQVAAGSRTAQIHPSVLRITGATLRSDGRSVEVVNYTDGDVFTHSNQPGRVERMVIGLAHGRARLHRVPVEDDVIDLTGYRLPTGVITGTAQAFEGVSVLHHGSLVHWMNHLAYGKQDADTFDPRKSEFHKQEFFAYCETVKAEWERYKHKNRVVRYGGI